MSQDKLMPTARKALEDREMADWQPIETAPKDGTVVVVFRGNTQFDKSFGPIRDYVERCELGWFEDGRWWESGTAHDMHEHWAVENGYAPTHWMPLPAQPTQGASDDQ